MAKKWIQGMKMDKGAFSKKAKAAGKSTAEFAAQVSKPGSKALAKTKKQAALAKTFAKIRPK